MVIGFIGVLLVVKPGYLPFQLGHLAAIGTGLATDAAIIILRRVGGKVKTTSMLGISARACSAAEARHMKA